VLDAMRPDTCASEARVLRADLHQLDHELANLMAAVATGGELTPLLEGIKVPTFRSAPETYRRKPPAPPYQQADWTNESGVDAPLPSSRPSAPIGEATPQGTRV
jgi:hypothetical protein